MRLLGGLIMTFFVNQFFDIAVAENPQEAKTAFEEVKNLSEDKTLQFPLFKALGKSGGNRSNLIKAIKNAPDVAQKRAVVFLIAFMPERDLRDLSTEFILDNVKWTYKAREKFQWAQQLPENIFLNDLLPYAVINERRDSWRKDFYNKFSPLVKDCKTAEEAVLVINKNIEKILKVKYSKQRKKADQSPFESMETGTASCTGLSILLIDAFRSVGIPARMGGIPMWNDQSGNHNWCEVYLNKKWVFTEYYMDSKGLNHGWLLKRAAESDSSKWLHRIYATSFSPTEFWFPCVWDMNIRFIHAVDVSKRYKLLWQSQQKNAKINSKQLKTVAVICYDKKNGSRVARKVTVKCDGKKNADGTTSKATDDMNNMLEFQLKRKKTFILEYKGLKNNLIKKTFVVDDNNDLQKIKIFLDEVH